MTFLPKNGYIKASPANEAHTFDAEAFDDAIRGQGVRFIHYRAMVCPVGMSSQYDSLQKPHEDHAGCSNGFIYKKVGSFYATFSVNGLSKDPGELGLMNGSQAQLTATRFYEDTDNKRVFVTSYDRLYLADENILVSNWQTFEAHVSGIDRLRFPAVAVEHLVDSLGREYTQGSDFYIKNGNIHWTGQNRPGVDSETGRGRVCSAWYTYHPYYYVKSLSHDVRVGQVVDRVTGVRSLEKLQQAFSVQREYLFEDSKRDDKAADPSDLRQQKSGRDGGFQPF